jgi:hypothetical protein
LQSNTFDTTWANSSTTETSGQSGYDDSSDAWKLDKTSADGYIVQSISSSGVQSFSVYAKSGTKNWIRLFIIAGTNADVFFNLSDGSLGTNSGVISATSQSIGGGWYRYVVVLNATISSVRIYPADADNDTSGTSGNIYIQDAMLNEGLVAQPYIETTTAAVYEGITDNLPRLDYSGGASCPSLLLEPSRTNFIPHSEYFSDWALDGDGAGQSVTANYSISPEGVQNAYRLQLNTTGGSYSRIRKSVTASYSGAGIFSVYLKTNDASTKTIRMRWSGSGDIQKTITGEWQRFDVQGTAIYTLASDCEIFLDFADNDVVDLSIYGAMQEAGSYPTSYIPTYGTSASRAKSFSNDNDLVDTPISFGANDDFTFFYEGKFSDLSADTSMICGGGRYQLGDDYKNYIWVRPTTLQITGFGEVTMASAPHSISDDTNTKILVKRSGSVITFFLNGVKLTTTQNTTNIAFTFRSFGWSYTNAVYFPSGSAKQFLVFPTALTDAEAIALTTL